MKCSNVKLWFLASFFVVCNLATAHAGDLTLASVSLSCNVSGQTGIKLDIRFTTATAMGDFSSITVQGVNFKVPSGFFNDYPVSCTYGNGVTPLSMMLGRFRDFQTIELHTVSHPQSIPANAAIHCTWSDYLTNSDTPQPATQLVIRTYSNDISGIVDSVAGVFFPAIINTATCNSATTSSVPSATAVSSTFTATNNSARKIFCPKASCNALGIAWLLVVFATIVLWI
jgi:hypothetical protein